MSVTEHRATPAQLSLQLKLVNPRKDIVDICYIHLIHCCILGGLSDYRIAGKVRDKRRVRVRQVQSSSAVTLP